MSSKKQEEINCLFIQGPPAVGKTTLAKRLADRLGWKHLDRDEMVDGRKIAAFSKQEAEEQEKEERKQAYKNLQKELAAALKSGEKVIVDAPFRDEDEAAFLAWIEGVRVPVRAKLVFLYLEAEERKKRRVKRGLPRDKVSGLDEEVRQEEILYHALSGALRLFSDLGDKTLEEIIVWYLEEEGRSIRQAAADDWQVVQELKERVLAESFLKFLTESEVKRELHQVARDESVKKLIAENTLLLAEEAGELRAIAALSPERAEGRTIFSAYSSGSRAATALIFILLSLALDERAEKILAWVYQGNEQSKAVMKSLRGRPGGDSHRSEATSQLVEHWEQETPDPFRLA